MRRIGALILLLCLLPVNMFSFAEEGATDGVYELSSLARLGEGEEAVYAAESSYYSGDPVYKGKTGRVLTGACALHCAAVVLSNFKQETISAQTVTAVNNMHIKKEQNWIAFVAWGKVAGAYGVSFTSFNMAQYGARLKQRGVKTAERRADKLNTLMQALTDYGSGVGVIAHFNSTGRLNGSGNRHAVVILGGIYRGEELVDLLISDSSVAAPQGACVRLSESSLPLSMLREKKLAAAQEAGENLALLMMDYLVSYRYIDRN